MPKFTTEPTESDREIAALHKEIAHQHAKIQRLGEQNHRLRTSLRECLDEIDCVEHVGLRLKQTGGVIRRAKEALKERT